MKFDSRVLFCLLTLLEMAPPVLDNLWTQDSPICPSMLSTNWDLISSKEGQQLGFEIFKIVQQKSRLSIVERIQSKIIGF